MSSESAAAYIGCTTATLKQWRHLGSGPAFYRGLARGIRYRREDLDGFIEVMSRASRGPAACRQERCVSAGLSKKFGRPGREPAAAEFKSADGCNVARDARHFNRAAIDNHNDDGTRARHRDPLLR